MTVSLWPLLTDGNRQYRVLSVAIARSAGERGGRFDGRLVRAVLAGPLALLLLSGRYFSRSLSSSGATG